MYPLLRRLVLAGISCCLLAAMSFADEVKNVQEMTLTELLSTKVTVASSKAENILNTVSTVSIIDQTTIERFNFSSVSEAVATVAGMDVWRTYMKQGVTISRGILEENFANKVLIMIDGVPAWNAVTGEGNLDRVAITDVERIEVLKGPASVLYGSNAFTGAINIVLKKASEGTQGEVVAGLGSGRGGYNGIGGSYRAGGRYSTANDDSSFYVSGNAVSDVAPDYLFVTETKQSVHINDYTQAKNFTMKATYKGHSLLFNSSWNDEDHLGFNISTMTGLGKNQTTEANLLNYTYYYVGDQLPWAKSYDLKCDVTYDWQRRNIARTNDDDLHTDSLGSRLTGEVISNMALSNYFNLEIGGDYAIRNCRHYTNYMVFEDKVVTENGLYDVSVNESSVYSQLGFSLNPWNIVVGSRYTDNQLCGTNTSSRGTIVYSINGSNSIKLIAGQSFRSPSLRELSAPTLGLTVMGDPTLKPETSTSYELDYLTTFGHFFIQADAYSATYENVISGVVKNLVVSGVAQNGITQYTNDEAFSAKGTELEIKYVLPKTETFLNLEYVDGSNGDMIIDAASHQPTYNFKYIPKFGATLGLSQDIGAFFVSAYAKYYSGMNGPFQAIDAEYWANGTIGYRHDNTTHCISVQNFTNSDIELPEFARRKVVNSVSLIRGIRIDYTFKVKFS